MEPEREGCISHREVLEKISSMGYSTPRDISESQYRENVVRVQCRLLAKRGLLHRITHDLYAVSNAGEEHLSIETNTPTIDCDIGTGELQRDDRRNDDYGSVTDFSEIDAETIKRFNYERLKDERDDYGLVNGSHGKTEKRIWNVQDLELHRVMNEFPTSEPLVQQCAHWVRAISGKHFFPDANHRTAMASLNAVLRLNGISVPDAWPGNEIGRTVLKSKFIRNFIVDIRFDNLWERDEHYWLWHRHFRNLFYETAEIQHYHVSTGRLRRALENARRTR